MVASVIFYEHPPTPTHPPPARGGAPPSLPGAPPLRMELDQTAWSTAEDKDHIWISIRPEDLLLLK